MHIEIRKYDAKRDYDQLQVIIDSEGDEWKSYLGPAYQNLLAKSITYVAVCDNKLCGYSRSLHDPGMYVWVIDLLVHSGYRGHSIGKKLMECLLTDFPDHDVYVLSDVDEYYQKIGYSKDGSLFKVGCT
ncbi:MAG: GNAT family N-acetyltransferase [Bacteroidia bacterium]|nr:GNAT family N-acetyltransferase [Bacteroidia bacterium]